MGQGKRKLTARLVNNWQQLIWQKISATNTRLRDAIAVIQLTGCRPSEIHSGVIVELDHSNEEHGRLLVFTIKGAKIDKVLDANGKQHQRGQPQRCLAVPISSEPASYLEKRLQERRALRVTYHRKSLSNRIVELGKQCFPRLREALSAYCYRHAFCAAMKSNGTERETIAAAMGHLSDYSQGSYGRSDRNKSGSVSPPIVDAFGSREVKHSKKTDRLLRFKIASKKREK